MGFLSVNIDLDEIYCYLAIHGLHETEAGSAAHAVYEKALPRAARFFDQLEVKATLFVVGRDLTDPKRASEIRGLVAKGHEAANHTMNHLYDFSVKSTETQTREIDEAHRVIADAVGTAPLGFRAPGYNINMGVIALLKQKGYKYDSSVFPCPSYYAAKAGAIGLKSLQGRQSKSIMGDPRILSASPMPYRIGEDGVWTRSDCGLCELPITVVTRARLPFIGTAIAVMGNLPAKLLAKQAAKLNLVNLELHGMDFLDAEQDDLAFLKSHQPDLKVPLAKRVKNLEIAVKTLLDAGLEPAPLRNVVDRLFI
jgi:hypothetical protein